MGDRPRQTNSDRHMDGMRERNGDQSCLMHSIMSVSSFMDYDQSWTDRQTEVMSKNARERESERKTETDRPAERQRQ